MELRDDFFWSSVQANMEADEEDKMLDEIVIANMRYANSPMTTFHLHLIVQRP